MTTIYRNSGWVIQGILHTPEGGVAHKKINKTGAASVKGTLVEPSTGTNSAVQTADANSDHPTGVMYEDGIPDGAECWVVFGGTAQVLLKNSTAGTRGNWLKMSDAAGRADNTVAAPPGADPTHWRELGHSEETVDAGTNVLMLATVHFN